MNRTTIMLPEELKLLAEREAYRRGISLGEVIRLALKDWVYPKKKNRSRDPLFDFNLKFDAPCEDDLSQKHDDYLYGEGE